jgi:hypothetical protein
MTITSYSREVMLSYGAELAKLHTDSPHRPEPIVKGHRFLQLLEKRADIHRSSNNTI